MNFYIFVFVLGILFLFSSCLVYVECQLKEPYTAANVTSCASSLSNGIPQLSLACHLLYSFSPFMQHQSRSNKRAVAKGSAVQCFKNLKSKQIECVWRLFQPPHLFFFFQYYCFLDPHHFLYFFCPPPLPTLFFVENDEWNG